MSPNQGSFFFGLVKEVKLEYKSLDSNPCYGECSELVASLGLKLVELDIVPAKTVTKISAVVASKDPAVDIGVADVAKAHRALAPKLMALLNKTEDDISMEVCSPGIERNIRNAAEFSIFEGRQVRVWDRNISDWTTGVIKASTRSEVTLTLEDGSEKSFAYDDIAKAKFIHI